MPTYYGTSKSAINIFYSYLKNFIDHYVAIRDQRTAISNLARAADCPAAKQHYTAEN